MSALDMFNLIRNKPRLSPMEIAMELHYSPQHVKNVVSILSQVKLIEAPYHGSYRLTAKGEKYHEILREDQPSEVEKT
jgi:Mn-dependent DtxR family transcriptional regulator